MNVRIVAVAVAALFSSLSIARAQMSSWEQVFTSESDAIVVTSQGNLVAHSGSLTYRSTDGGTTWSEAGALAEELTVLRLDGQGRIYAGTWDGGLYRSSDEGDTWSRISSPARIWDVAVDSHGDIFMATEGSYVVRSTDDGATWASVGSDGMGPFIWAVHVDSQDRLFAGAQGEGIFRSTNGGSTWSQRLEGFVVNAIASDASGTMFAAMDDGGIYRSTDAGLTWDRTPLADLAGEGRMSVSRPIAVDDHGGVYATGVILGAGFRYATFRSTDEGATWSEYEPNPVADNVVEYAIVVDAHGSLFVATGSGIYRLQGAASSVDEAVDQRETTILSAATPDPVRRECRFEVSVPEAGFLSLRILNSAGIEVARLHDGVIDAGNHRFEWDAAGAPAGVYFCRADDGRTSRVRKVVVLNGR